jgi:hypothetical protein
MLKISLTLSGIAFLAITAASQQPVVAPGQPEELKGVTRIYVSAASKDARNSIIGEIKKRLPQLTITERSEEAEVWLLFSIERRSFSKANPAYTLGASRTSGTSEEYEMVASGAVIKPVTKESARRLIEFRDTAETTTSFPEQALSAKFAKAFVKAHRKANP